MTPEHPHGQGHDRPDFDPRRSAEIRSLLLRTVSATPRPRTARLSRTAFSLAATAALLFAGGIGAGTVAAYDRLSDELVAQSAGGPADADDESAPTPAAESQDAAASDSAASDNAASDNAAGAFTGSAGDLVPVLTLDGEVGYLYQSDLEAAELALQGAAAAAAGTAESSAAAGGIPIYLADGMTVLGHLDPTGLIP